MSTALTIIDKARNAITPIEKSFSAVEGLKLSFQKEMGFAIQILSNPKNQYLAGLALANQQDIQTAVYNVALTGLSLNPILRHGYLLPRGGRVIFEPSYMGLIEVLIQAGTIIQMWGYLVHENDYFLPQFGTNPGVEHTKDIKRPLGKIVGAYAVALLPNKERQFELMTIEEVMRIKARSEAVKAGKGSPWDSDPEEMIQKTVFRRIFKRLPKTNLSEAALNALQIFDDNNAIDYDAALPPSENDPAASIRAARLNGNQSKQLPAVNPTETPTQDAVIAPETSASAEQPPIDEKERLVREAIEKGEQKIAKYSTTDELNDIHVTISNLQNPVVKDALIAALLDRSNELGFDFDSGTEKFVEIADEPITEAPEDDIPEPPPAMVAPPPRVNMAAVMEQREQSKKVPDFSF